MFINDEFKQKSSHRIILKIIITISVLITLTIIYIHKLCLFKNKLLCPELVTKSFLFSIKAIWLSNYTWQMISLLFVCLFGNHKCEKKLIARMYLKLLFKAMGCRQFLPISVVQLKGKHCQKTHCCNGVADTFVPTSLLLSDCYFPFLFQKQLPYFLI